MKLLTKLEKFKISLKTNAKSGAKKPLEKTFVPPTLSPDSFHRQHDISGLLLEKNCNTNNYFGALFLYQFKRCPYSGKIRALLDRLGLWYTLLEVDPRSKKMLDWSSFATVPVLRIKSDRHKIAIGESNVIIDFLLDEALNYKLINRDIYENWTSEGVRETQNWIDEKIMPYLLCYLCRSRQSTNEAFSYLNEMTSNNFLKRFLIRIKNIDHVNKMKELYQKIKKNHNITNPYEDLIKELNKYNEKINKIDKVRNKMDFQPNLVDLSLFGAIRMFTDLDDFKRVLEDSELLNWYKNTEKTISKSFVENYLFFPN